MFNRHARRNSMPHRPRHAILSIAAYALFSLAIPGFAAQNSCSAQSASTLTPVIELYTSEGCSSCPPADQWVSTLKTANAKGQVVAQAFHVNYWDYIGWTDRFAAPVHTVRQRQISSANRLDGIYTPQLVKNGTTTRAFSSSITSTEPAKAQIQLSQTADNSFEAQVTPVDAQTAWTAYFTVTEHSHTSRVTAGENKGENLAHDFVVRQYVPLGNYSGAQKLKLSTLPATAQHPRQINLVVTEANTGKPLQALSAGC
jgi:hypothetical protein